jgi:uncharacterized membrane protein
MSITYNRIAGQSAERLAALSDGIFGVAMTLLLLDLKVPDKAHVHGDAALQTELLKLLPGVAVYLLSFITLGIFWVGQQTQLNHLNRSDRHLTWIHLGFLFGVTLLPFSTRLLIDYIHLRTALLCYWANILLLGVMLYASWGRATRAKLLEADVTHELQAAICRRIIIAQSLYAVGAALCFFSTYVSIAVIVLVQLNYVIAPSGWRANIINDAADPGSNDRESRTRSGEVPRL